MKKDPSVKKKNQRQMTFKNISKNCKTCVSKNCKTCVIVVLGKTDEKSKDAR